MRRRSGLLGLVLSLALLVSLAVPVSAAPIPDSFYGTVTIGGSPALPGTELTAVVEGGGGSYTITVAGQYGSATNPFDKLVVSGDIEGGALIEFYAGGAKADQTAIFHGGRDTNLNLTVSGPPETLTITATAGDNGSIEPSGEVVVNSGASQAFTITPDTGYDVDDVLVDDVSVGAVTSYNFTNVTADHTIHATFILVVETFTISAAAGTGGTIEPSGEVVVNSGASQAFTITADIGYVVDDVLVDDVSVGAVTSYNFTNVTADHTIYAGFAAVETFTITATAGAGGSISPSGDVVVNSGANQAFTITPDTGYVVAEVLIDSLLFGAVTSYLFENVTANHTIDASFAAVETFTITATAGAGGSISPSGDVVVNSGASQAFTITRDIGYVVDDVLVDDVSVGAVASYTFADVTADHTIHASFAEVEVFNTILSADWNLLSTPIKLAADSDAIEQIFDTTSQGNIEILYHWDAVGEKWDPILAGYELLPLYAIYVKVKPDASAMAMFISCGELSWPPSRELQPGLNLIGPAPAFVDGNFEVMPLDQALISIEEAEGGLTGYTMVISPEHNQPGWTYGLGGEIRDLLPYQGYWVVMENADTLLGWSTTPIQ